VRGEITATSSAYAAILGQDDSFPQLISSSQSRMSGSSARDKSMVALEQQLLSHAFHAFETRNLALVAVRDQPEFYRVERQDPTWQETDRTAQLGKKLDSTCNASILGAL